MKKQKIKIPQKRFWVTLGIIILIILILGIGWLLTEYKNWKDEIEMYAFMEGYDMGMKDIIIKINQERSIPILKPDGFVDWVKLNITNSSS